MGVPVTGTSDAAFDKLIIFISPSSEDKITHLQVKNNIKWKEKVKKKCREYAWCLGSGCQSKQYITFMQRYLKEGDMDHWNKNNLKIII